MSGPLTGYRVIEIAGIGPGPFAAMLLSDMGAEVIRVERAGAVRGPAPDTPHPDILRRGRRNVAIDLKHPDGVATLLDLVEHADALIEGFRPGVMERLGVGPDVCLARNPRLVFGRMTGWGQDGPYSSAAGHDINYIALAGALAHFGRAGQPPTPPMNMVGDFGGGGMFLAFGVVCALLEAQRSGHGQVVDTAMVDGTAILMTMFWAMSQMGVHDIHKRGDEPARHRCPLLRRVRVLRRRVRLDRFDRAAVLRRTAAADRARRDEQFARRWTEPQWPASRRAWPRSSARSRATSGARSWSTPTCASRRCCRMDEALDTRTTSQRGTFVEVDGVTQPAPAPRFSRTTPTIDRPPAHDGQHTDRGARRLGHPDDRIEANSSSPGASSRPDGHARLLPRSPRRRGDRDRRDRWRAPRRGTSGGADRARPTGHTARCRTISLQGETLADRRRDETTASAAALGIDRVEFLGYSDSGMTGWEQNERSRGVLRRPTSTIVAGRLADLLRDERADVFTIYDWHGGYGHPDHIQVHRVGEPGRRARADRPARTCGCSSRR